MRVDNVYARHDNVAIASSDLIVDMITGVCVEQRPFIANGRVLELIRDRMLAGRGVAD